MAESDALAAIAEELGVALQPLVDATSSPAALHDFLLRFGWDLPTVTGLLQLQGPASQVNSLVNDLGPDDDIDVTALLNGLRAAYQAVGDISSMSGLPTGFTDEFPRRLVDFLICDYLLHHQPRWGHLLLTLGVLRLQKMPADGGRPAYVRRVVAFEDLGGLVEDPLAFFGDAYGWGTSGFRGEDLQQRLGELFRAWGRQVRSTPLDPATLAQLQQGATSPGDAVDVALRLVLVQSSSTPALEAGTALFLLPETAAAKPGFAVLPYGTAGLDVDIALSDFLTLAVEGTLALDGGVGALVRPDQDLEVVTGIGSGAPGSASGTLSLGLLVGGDGGDAIVLLGDPEASRFELDRASVTGGTRFRQDAFEVYVECAVQGARIVIAPGDDADSFLAQLLPPEGLAVTTDLTVGFSTTQGLYFGGSGGLEVSLPAHLQLGPVEVMGATLAVRFRNDAGVPSLPIELGATAKGDLAVIKAVVENVGMTATLTFPDDQRGNLGPVNLALGFKPPKGVGLTIDAGVVQGGGYLYLDADKGEYAGALELVVSGFLSLRAIGLINTQLPGGEPGFSMLVIITAEFVPGFQLGFGFTLAGVGGLLGLHRGVLLEPLALGVRTGAVNNILFPRDVVANAPRIISDLRAIFPPKPGTFLIGPMAKIGWGTPTLVSVSLGVIIEIPGNVVILGRLRLNLPTEDDPLLLLQLTFVGALELDKRRLWFFASLYESRILFITLEGEMGLLMDYSDNPDFVLSVGGFHPRFTPPPLPFPSPARLSLSLIDESFARVRVETYVAITTNTVQLGARAEAFFGFDALSVEGYFSFDALLRFSPVYFIVEISSGFSVKVFGMGVYGIHLRGSLEGPAPWHIAGRASIEFLFFSISVDVDETFGEPRLDTLPSIPVLPSLRAELEKLDSWRAVLPGAGRQLVTLRDLGDSGLLVLHPVGVLQVSQRFVPLNLPLDKIGNQAPSDVRSASVTITSGPLEVRGPTRERFAAAQFREMDDAAKLSAPAFEPFDSGVELGAGDADWVTGPAATRNVRFETTVIDTPAERKRLGFLPFPSAMFAHFAAHSAVGRSSLSLATERLAQPFAERIEVAPDEYVVANVADNSPIHTFGSHAEASAHVTTLLASDPALASEVHVIPMVEANVA